jgi:hypothetical protein
MSHVELRLHMFPNARDTDDIQLWEVLVVTDAGVISNGIHNSTMMYNFYPRTRKEQIEHEAREHANGLALKLGLEMRCSAPPKGGEHE